MSKVYFLSDAHLGAEKRDKEGQKESHLLAFFEQVKKEGSEIYILGDLFDFFFEYRTVIPARHYRVIEKLADLVRSGIKITYVVGNHDYWLGSFFREELGVIVSHEPIEVSLQGKRLFLAHGDGIGNSSRGDRALKSLLRSPLTIELFSWIHPDVGAAIAKWVSGRSREKSNSKFETQNQKQNQQSNVNISNDYLEMKVQETFHFAKKKFEEGFDGVVCGHIHLPRIYDEKGKTFLILGDWIRYFSYGVLTDGKLFLEYFKANPNPL